MTRVTGIGVTGVTEVPVTNVTGESVTGVTEPA